ncbi:MAG TPA: DUF1801 domain-containing protein [Candidatus Cybelea sp.]|jgi:uncharacterized protein YdhG (YjbR/CyaY superfamily)|nr:DUF1801 domain-containing protein [Candidatus Cybelea sp.]
MTKTIFKSVDEYIAAQPESARRILERVRRTIRESAPAAQETISYNMPAYKLDDVSLLHFAGWKAHYSLYATTDSVLAAFEDDLRRYKLEKGTIRIPLSEPVPTKLIARITRFREREIAKLTPRRFAARTAP